MSLLTERSKVKTWIDFFSSVFGLEGWIYRDYDTHEKRKELRSTDGYKNELRIVHKQIAKGRIPKATHMITIRMPKELHDQLKTRAHEEQLSMNKFCLQRLIT